MRKLLVILFLFPFYATCQVPFMLVDELESTVDSLVEIASIDNGNEYWDVCYDGNYIITARDDSGLTAYTFDGSNISREVHYDPNFYSMLGIYTDGDYIYVANGFNGLVVYSFDGSSFSFIDKISWSGDFMEEVWGNQTSIFVADRGQTKIRKIRFNGSTLNEISNHNFSSGNENWDVYANEDYVASSNANSVSIFDTTLTELDNYSTGGNEPGVAIKGDTIYYGCNNFEIYTYNTSLSLDSSMSISQVFDFYIYDSELYSVTASSVYKHNANDYSLIAENSTTITNGRGVWYDGQYIYVADRDLGLKIYELQSVTK